MVIMIETVEFIISNSYDGVPRKLFKGMCQRPECNNIFYVPKNRLKDRKYCGKSCAILSNITATRSTYKCAVCEKDFERIDSKAKSTKSGLVFCGKVCHKKAQRFDGIKEVHPEHYSIQGVRSYRTRAFRAYGTVCKSCGYTEDDRMLDVDHIDGDRSNNVIENLQVFCVWCHAKKTRKDWPHFNKF